MREISSQQQIKSRYQIPRFLCTFPRKGSGATIPKTGSGRLKDHWNFTQREKQIEEKVLFDVEFRKYQAQIPQEDTTQTAYDFTITQKK